VNNAHTVIVLAYNHERYISAALHSVLSGQRIADQVIVVDDCSTDLTVEIVKNIQRKYPKIVEIVENESNLGIFDNLNHIYQIPVKGNLISFLAGDDIYDLSLLGEIDSAVTGSGLNPHYDKFMMLPQVANLFLDGSISKLDNSIVDKLENVTPFQIALRSKLYSMHVGISISLYKEWARFPKNAMNDIGIFADLPHFLQNIKACDFLVPIYSATTYHRVGVGITSRSLKLSPQESRYRAMRLIANEFKKDLNFSDRCFLNFSMAIDSVYVSRSILGFFRIIAFFPLALLIDKIDKSYYFNSIHRLAIDLANKLINTFIKN
jgi:glycosyltransferase involved in cell wall biosynthesis